MKKKEGEAEEIATELSIAYKSNKFVYAKFGHKDPKHRIPLIEYQQTKVEFSKKLIKN